MGAAGGGQAAHALGGARHHARGTSASSFPWPWAPYVVSLLATRAQRGSWLHTLRWCVQSWSARRDISESRLWRRGWSVSSSCSWKRSLLRSLPGRGMARTSTRRQRGKTRGRSCSDSQRRGVRGGLWPAFARSWTRMVTVESEAAERFARGRVPRLPETDLWGLRCHSHAHPDDFSWPGRPQLHSVALRSRCCAPSL